MAKRLPSPFQATAFRRADAERLAAVLKALADPSRLLILRAIWNAGPAGLSQVAVIDALGELSQPTMSHHARVLSNAGLVAKRHGSVTLTPEGVLAVALALDPAAGR